MYKYTHTAQNVVAILSILLQYYCNIPYGYICEIYKFAEEDIRVQIKIHKLRLNLFQSNKENNN